MSTVALLRRTDESERSPEVRENMLFDLPRIERAVHEMLFAVGEDPDRDGLVETPRRVARAYAELLGGLREDPAQHLGRVFNHCTENDDLVLVRGIEFSSLCEYHLLPFNGTAQVAYLPAKGRVVGLSKVARTARSTCLRAARSCKSA
jgi:GTP cyclohydrolase IA